MWEPCHWAFFCHQGWLHGCVWPVEPNRASCLEGSRLLVLCSAVIVLKFLNAFGTTVPLIFPFCTGPWKLRSQFIHFHSFSPFSNFLGLKNKVFSWLPRSVHSTSCPQGIPMAQLHFPSLELSLKLVPHSVVTMLLFKVHVNRSGSSFKRESFSSKNVFTHNF